MYTIQPKKLLIINILNILKKYTDVNHRLSQKEIVELLQKEYSMEVNRKAVKRNLMNLIDFGYPISTANLSAPAKAAKRRSSIPTGIWSMNLMMEN